MKGPVCVESSYAIKVQITDIRKRYSLLSEFSVNIWDILLTELR
jgi:hypothetical protein